MLINIKAKSVWDGRPRVLPHLFLKKVKSVQNEFKWEKTKSDYSICYRWTGLRNSDFLCKEFYVIFTNLYQSCLITCIGGWFEKISEKWLNFVGQIFWPVRMSIICLFFCSLFLQSNLISSKGVKENKYGICLKRNQICFRS